MTLLSIDPGTRHMGLVWWENDAPTAWLTEHATSYEAMVERLIARLRYVDVVAVEGAYAGPNPQTTILLAEFVGAVRGLCIDRGIPCHKAMTAEIDTRCGIKPGLERKERKLYTAALGRLRLGDEAIEHEYDAHAVGVWALGEGTLAAWAEAARRAGRD